MSSQLAPSYSWAVGAGVAVVDVLSPTGIILATKMRQCDVMKLRRTVKQLKLIAQKKRRNSMIKQLNESQIIRFTVSVPACDLTGR